MSLIGNDFVERVEAKTVYCSECGRKILPGEKSLVSLKGGKVKKRVCSEECRQTFDDAIWQAFADENEKRRKGAAHEHP